MPSFADLISIRASERSYIHSIFYAFIISPIFFSFLSACAACGPEALPDGWVSVELIADPQNGGTVEGEGAYESGSRITIKAIPSSAYHFSGWYIDNVLQSDDSDYSFIILDSMIITARFFPGCAPSCENRECGPDGCGGFCSPGCSDEDYCDNGICIDLPPGNCSLPWGGMIENEESVNAYSTESVPCGEVCPPHETRTCNNGTLSGSGDFENCTEEAPICPAGNTRCSGNDVEECSADGCRWDVIETCPEDQSCNNARCEPVTPGSCQLPWGGSIDDGESVPAYSLSNVACGHICPPPEMRECNDGLLSGSFIHVTCEPDPYVCLPGEAHCDNNDDAQQCNDDGCDWTVHSCPDDKPCSDGICGTGVTYYVDADKGSDGFDGLAGTQVAGHGPWKSFANLTSTPFQPGDKVLLKRGCVWNESLMMHGQGHPGALIEIGAYGSGPRPIIRRDGDKARDTLYWANAAWARVSSITVMDAGQGIRLVGNGQGSLYIEDCIAINIRGRYGDSEFPGHDGWSMGIAAINAGSGNGYSSSIENSEVMGGGGGIFLEDDGSIERCYVHNATCSISGFAGIATFNGAFTIDRCLLDSAVYHAEFGTSALLLQHNNTVRTSTFKNSIVRNTPHTNAYDQCGVDFEQDCRNVVIDNVVFEGNAGPAIEFLRVHPGVINSYDIVIKNSKFIRNCWAQPQGRHYEIAVDAQPVNVNIHDNQYELKSGIDFIGGGGDLSGITLSNNVATSSITYLSEPQVDAGFDRHTTTGTVVLSDAAIDYAGEAVTVKWEQLTGPGIASFSSASSVNPTVTLPDAGIYVLRMVADNGTFWKSDYVTVSYSHATVQSLFSNQIPDSHSNDMELELGIRFRPTVDGTITGVRIFTNNLEGGARKVRIWDAAEEKRIAGPYTWSFDSGTYGWRQYGLPIPLEVKANTDYIVSVSTGNDRHYSLTINGLSSPVYSKSLTAFSGSGVYSTTIGAMPTMVYGDSNYYRDIVFVPKPQTIFTDEVPSGYSNDAEYELGTRFRTEVDGMITGVRIFTNSFEGGNHKVRVWRVDDSSCISGPHLWTFSPGEDGWKEFQLPVPIDIVADTDYIVAVSNSTDRHYAITMNGFEHSVNNQNLITYTGSGVYSTMPGEMPANVHGDSNYFRDVVFVP